MKDLIKQIRSYMGLSQKELAEKLSVTFATLNRWENGHAEPNRIAQAKLFDCCKEAGVPVFEMTIQRIQDAAASIPCDPERIVLYHGSKAGLVGPIEPKSRSRCDFGKGFYMGTEPYQPLTLVCDFDKSKFYIVSLDLSTLNSLELPPDLEWAMTVAYYRGKTEKARGTPFYQKYENLAEGKDVLIGSIANDRIFYVLDNFFLGNITDLALIKSLSALNLGKQYVAITEKACNVVRIEKEIKISLLERMFLREVAEQNRIKGVSLANDICKNYRREGRFFDEILDEAMEE